MEVREALLKRRSIRKFTEEAVAEEMIGELMHAAMSGPSACNKRPWEFYVVTNKDKLQELKGASRFTGYDAPLAIVVVGNLSKALPMQLSEFWVQDCSAATENVLLRATDMGLGAVWCGLYPQKKPAENVKKMLELSDKQVPLNVIFVGWPAEEQEAKDWFEEKSVHYVK